MPRIRRFVPTFLFLCAALAVAGAGPAGGHTHHDSPVQWREFSAATLAQAEREDKPIFMVISAVWCWNCMVYEEALDRAEVAAYLNRHYIPVFVDYDRRRDVARTYPAAGIPVTVIFAADGQRVVTVPGYFTPEELLANLRLTRARLAELPAAGVAARAEGDSPRPVRPSQEMLRRYLEDYEGELSASFDPVFGGFGTAQKEARADVLLRLVAMSRQGDERWRYPLQLTVRNLLGAGRESPAGPRPPLPALLELRARQIQRVGEVLELQDTHRLAGLYDSVGGGFFRYATRRDWTVPHFEKMLFGNAGLIHLLLEAYRWTGEQSWRAAAESSLQYLLDTLYLPGEGRLLGSQQADGVYYHLNAAERRTVPAPGIDPTTYTAASARALVTLVHATEILGRREYRTVAQECLEFLLGGADETRGAASYFDPAQGRWSGHGQLAANVWLATALLEAHRAWGDDRWRERAFALLGLLETDFYDREAGAFWSHRTHLRGRDGGEEAPLGAAKDPDDNGRAAVLLLRAWELSGRESLRDLAAWTVGYFAAQEESGLGPGYASGLHEAAAHLLVPPPRAAAPAFPDRADRLADTAFPVLLVLSVVAGLLSFLSPCTLPVLPAYFAFAFPADRSRVFRLCFAFFLGLGLSFSALGMSATAFGALLHAQRWWIGRGAGVLILLLGVASILGKGFSGLHFSQRPARSVAAAFGFGLLFAIGWSTCVGPILAGILVLAATREQALSGGALLLAFACGLGLPLILLSQFLPRIDRAGRLWSALRGRSWETSLGPWKIHLHTAGLLSGLLLIGLGTLMVADQLTLLNRLLPSAVQAWFSGLEKALLGLLAH